jgi:2-amino-4-hydroxy-6-hydroxymethyldihydropteridine diphosphokinase
VTAAADPPVAAAADPRVIRAADPPAIAPGRPARVVIAIGSNLGDRMANLQGAVDAVFGPSGIGFLAVSPVYETVPVGGPSQPDFLNAVVLGDALLPAREVLDRCLAAEAARHRVRGITWGPRTLDVDVIAYGDVVSDDPVLTLPHPRAHQRAFVLAPWHDVDPDARIPGRGLVADLLAAIGGAASAGVRRVPGALRPPS